VLWIGTDGGGLNRFQEGRFTALKTANGLANDIVLSLHADDEGSLWIGTSGGLSRLKDGALASFTTANGLFDDVVFQILEDARGNLWMSCNKGVSRVSKTELEDLAKGKIGSVSAVSYGTADGMKSRECNGGFQPAGWRTHDGRLWFPTIKGVAVIDPDNINQNPFAPPVMIEQVLVDHEPIDIIDQVSLAPGKSKFEFHYTALSFIAPEKLRFRYRLDGFDNSWVDAGTKREAAYTNIPPGAYTFRVIACNNDGVWNETGSAFHFYLKPRFHQTSWFYALCAVLIGLIGLGLYRLRVRQIKAQFAAVLAERNRIAREIHDTLAQGFAGISLQLEAVDETLNDTPTVARDHLNRARRLVRSSLAEARRSVWQWRSPALENAGLASALSAVAHELTAGSPIVTQVNVKGAVRRLSALVENNLLHIGREALTNAIKHARAHSIDVELTFEPAKVRLRITDDGVGFVAPQSTPTGDGGLGLISMRERAQQIAGRLVIASKPGGGTEVVVELSE
jgi:two-component sensor histidine kinase